MAHSISMGVASAILSQKLAPKYRVLLHFIISNERFKLASKTLWNWEVQQDPGKGYLLSLALGKGSILGKGSPACPHKKMG